MSVVLGYDIFEGISNYVYGEFAFEFAFEFN